MLLLGNAFFTTISMLTGIVLARWLGREGRGLVALFATTPQIIFRFSNMGVGSAVSYYLGRKQYETSVVLSSALAFGAVSSTAATVLLFLLIPPSSEYWEGIPLWALISICPLTIAVLWQNIGTRFHMALFHVHYSALSRIIQGLVRFCFILLLVIALRFGVTGAIVSSCLELVVACVVVLFLAGRYVNIEYTLNVKLIYRLMHYGIRNWLFMLFAGVNTHIGIYLLNYYSDAGAVGLFATGQGFCLFLMMVPEAWTSLLLPRVAGSDPNTINEQTLRLCRNGLLILLVLGGLIMLAAPTMVTLLYGQAFAQSTRVVWVIMPGLLFLHIYRVLAVDFAGRARQIIPIITSLTSLVVNILVGIVLIPRNAWYGGIVGASLALTFSTLLMAVIISVFYSKNWNVSLRKLFFINADDITFYKSRLSRLISNKDRNIQSKGKGE
ncbi:MAG TPA: oligosaccharide flippase family protein [Planctomycetes bacterium]|nr:oligosaccharide flippase family protein [Planctomycetota bacterium]